MVSIPVIGLVGFKGSGKDTVAGFLTARGYVKDSFAAPLKDAAAAIFGWDREMLEGFTKESREWREQRDDFWSLFLDKPNFTPRLALQLLGTESGRNVFGRHLWTSSLGKRVSGRTEKGTGTVVTDVRFDNEIDKVNSLRGVVVRVARGPEPSWYQDALWNKKQVREGRTIGHKVPESIREIHSSEWDWVGNHGIHATIFNDGSLEDLERNVDVTFNLIESRQ